LQDQQEALNQLHYELLKTWAWSRYERRSSVLQKNRQVHSKQQGQQFAENETGWQIREGHGFTRAAKRLKNRSAL
jgi:hypothetical protein